MSWRNPMRRFVLLGGAVLWLTGVGVLAQEESFFAGARRWGSSQSRRAAARPSMTTIAATVMAPISTMESSARRFAAPLSRCTGRAHLRTRCSLISRPGCRRLRRPASVTAPTALWRQLAGCGLPKDDLINGRTCPGSSYARAITGVIIAAFNNSSESCGHTDAQTFQIASHLRAERSPGNFPRNLLG